MVDPRYHKSTIDHYVFAKEFLTCNFINLFLYIEDMLIVTSSVVHEQVFYMKNLGPVQQLLDTRIVHNMNAKKLLSQKKCIERESFCGRRLSHGWKLKERRGEHKLLWWSVLVGRINIS